MPGWDAWQPPAERAGHKREEETPAVKKTLVEELMTIPVVTATKAIPFRDLAALLYARDISAVPVVTAAGQVLGIVSNHDLIEKAAGPPAAAGPRQHGSRRRDRRSLGRTAGDLMTAPAVTIPPHATIGQAAGLMLRHRIGRLPVTSPSTGRLTGIVSRCDLLRVYRRPGEEIRAEILTEVVPQVPGADPAAAGGIHAPRRRINIRPGQMQLHGSRPGHSRPGGRGRRRAGRANRLRHRRQLLPRNAQLLTAPGQGRRSGAGANADD